VRRTICNRIGYIDITNWCCAAVSVDEQLPEDGLERPKHFATECDFNDILK
jgi:hypothetical protein